VFEAKWTHRAERRTDFSALLCPGEARRRTGLSGTAGFNPGWFTTPTGNETYSLRLLSRPQTSEIALCCTLV
jgi:hypothetical protein